MRKNEENPCNLSENTLFTGVVVLRKCREMALQCEKIRCKVLYQYLTPYMAGAEGLEPSARGFGVRPMALSNSDKY